MGKRTSITTKTNSLSEATKFFMQFQANQDALQAELFVNTSIREFIREYILYSQLVHSKSTTRDFETTFRYFMRFFGYTKPLKELTHLDIQKYIHDRIEKTSIHQARKDLINLKSAFHRAIEIGMLRHNPTAGIKSIRRPEKLPLFYTEEDFEKLIEAIDDSDIKDLVVFAVNTGMRQKELITLEWRNIDFKRGLLVLDNNNFVTKTKRVRSIPLNKTAIEILERRKFLPFKQFSLSEENQLFKITSFIHSKNTFARPNLTTN
jgi:integrase